MDATDRLVKQTIDGMSHVDFSPVMFASKIIQAHPYILEQQMRTYLFMINSLARQAKTGNILGIDTEILKFAFEMDDQARRSHATYGTLDAYWHLQRDWV
jgi:hypothetical protein